MGDAPPSPRSSHISVRGKALIHAPNRNTGLRACIQCRLIQTKDQFYQTGCPECKLDMAENEGRVLVCTTTNFQGYIALLRPGAFVSRFNGLEKRTPGLYAL